MPAGGQQAQRAEGAPSGPKAQERRGWRRLPPFDLKRKREVLTIKVKYRGGPECWYEIHARGCVGRFPGVIALHDVMQDIYGCSRVIGQ